VVVGVNGTAAGLAAVRLAARESVARGRPLRVVHAFTWPSYDASAGGVPYDLLRRRATEVLARAVTTATRSAPAARVTGHLVDGPPTRVLLQHSRTADLLVLGDDDPGATIRLPTESVVVQVVARSRCPVLLARGVGMPDGAIVVGVDGSPAADLALRYATAEAVRRHAGMDVLHVLEPTDGSGAPEAAMAGRPGRDAARARAGLVDGAPVQGIPAQRGPEQGSPAQRGPEQGSPAQRGPEQGSPAQRGPEQPGPEQSGAGPARTAHLVRAHLLTGDPATMLARASTRARLLVIGPSGTDGRFGTLLGAVAQTVLRRSACPTVFVHGVRAPAHGPAEPPEGVADPPNG
jgi:nucleotide-binding universal stress UspA family protein